MKLFLISQLGFNDMIIVLYAIVGFMSLFSYLPQIITLARATRPPESISLTTWGSWVFETMIGLLYAITILKDVPAIGVALIDFSGCIAVFSLTLYARYVRFADAPLPLPSARQS